jgi:hypothetical protein
MDEGVMFFKNVDAKCWIKDKCLVRRTVTIVLLALDYFLLKITFAYTYFASEYLHRYKKCILSASDCIKNFKKM